MASMTTERTGMGMQGMTGMAAPATGAPVGTPGVAGWTMVPRCTVKIEKSSGGIRMICSCPDPMATSMVQNLCATMAGGMYSCCLMMNGMVVCSCNLTLGMCKCEMTKDGVAITCTSGDAQCAQMIQACGECMATLLRGGCTCCLLLNNMPVCCGCA